MVAIIGGNLWSADNRLDFTRQFVDAGLVEYGPTHPTAVEMFEYVGANSAPGDVVAGPKARALTFETDRRAVQVDQWRPLPTDFDPVLVVTERNDPTEATMRSTHADRYVEAWANSRFVVFAAIDPRAP